MKLCGPKARCNTVRMRVQIGSWDCSPGTGPI